MTEEEKEQRRLEQAQQEEQERRRVHRNEQRRKARQAQAQRQQELRQQQQQQRERQRTQQRDRFGAPAGRFRHSRQPGKYAEMEADEQEFNERLGSDSDSDDGSPAGLVARNEGRATRTVYSQCGPGTATQPTSEREGWSSGRSGPRASFRPRV